LEKSELLMTADGFYEKNVESVSFFMRVASREGIFYGSEHFRSAEDELAFSSQLQMRGRHMTFRSILFARTEDHIQEETLDAPDFFADLNLDQVIDAITAGRKEYHLKPFFYTPLKDIDAITYRHDILRDFENHVLFEHIQSFAQKMRTMREYLAQADKLYYKYQKVRWFLDAVGMYCDAVTGLARDVSLVDLHSRGFVAFRDYVTDYARSDRFTALLAETQKLQTDLSTVHYCLLIRGNSVKVRKYESESDYSAEVEETFAKFKQGAVKDYRVKFRVFSEMDHVEAQILGLVARLYPDIFGHLDDYCAQNGKYLDETIAIFDREIQFYVAYLEYIAVLKRAGLPFCYPHLSETSKDVYDVEWFDLALAAKLVAEHAPVVCNDFSLKGAERIVTVTGPNQGGKTTFARTFGQVHYLASLGCLVPGREAQLFLFDRLFTHFEKEETISDLRGKLQDDLVRIHHILNQATPNSIVILNEMFTSTTVDDALFLSKKIMERILQLDLLCVWVTFIDELASFSEKTVSMVSTVVPDNPAERTFKIVRKPADGLAYAFAIAEKYRLTYESVKERIHS
jgi:DNA mismatch repair protein MutS